jgi:mannose-6-phosphate isomerase
MPDVIECMASSANVIRAGLTQKYRDTPTLIKMLSYSQTSSTIRNILPGSYKHVALSVSEAKPDSTCVLYNPPAEEFSVIKTDLNYRGAAAIFEALNGPSIVLCTQGEGVISLESVIKGLKPGYVFFVGAGKAVAFRSNTDIPLVTFRAFCEVDEPLTAAL